MHYHLTATGVYFTSCNLDPKAKELGALSGTKDPAVTFTEGIDQLCAYQKPTTKTSVVIGKFLACKNCNTILSNFGYRRDTGDLRIGVFPGTFTKHFRNFPQSWQPKWHQYVESAVIPVHLLDDGLPKFVQGFGSAPIKGAQDVGAARDDD